MIITVTPNTSIDRTMVLPYFQWGKTIRSQEAVIGMGGKGTDASWVLGELGIETLALGFAAGPTGQQMVELLQERGVKTDFIWVDGDTRTNIILIDGDSNQQSTITANSLLVSEEHIKLLKKKYEEVLVNAKCAIIGGSLPIGVPEELFTELIQTGREHGIPVVFDSSGTALKTGLGGRPSVIKPNQDELQGLVGRKLKTIEEIESAAREIYKRFDCIVIATLGEKGALAVSNEASLIIEPPQVNVKNTAGAGDAIIAGVAHALAEKLPLEEGLRLGFAAAASVCTSLATASCNREEVDAFMDQVQISKFG
jgi:1-phosphofructokinase family hexose kinase